MHTTQLPFFAVIRATGDDAADFLHNQFSNDIKNLPANQACYATYNTPKGRVIANLIAQNTGNEILLALAADLVEAVVKRLKMYVLRAKVQFEILPDWGVAGSLKSNTPPQHPSEPQLSFP
ncbi:YgfZ/GcvT domain-containing protein, partial [Kingella oralis]